MLNLRCARHVHPAASWLISLLAWASPVSAEPEFWNWYEWRVPVVAKAPLTDRPVQLRVLSDLRFGPRYPGLGLAFLRTGPVWSLADWAVLALHGTVIPTQVREGVWVQEYRLEVEPTVSGRLGDWTWSDRNRLEYRMRPDDQHFRYRNLLRFNLAPQGATCIPYAWDEALVELSPDGFAQNRAEIGIGHVLGGPTRLDVGLMARSRRGSDGVWAHDTILHTSWVFTPDIDPLFP